MLVPGWFTSALLGSIAALTLAESDVPSLGSTVLDQLVLTGDATADIGGAIRKAMTRGLTDAGVRVLDSKAGPAGPCADASCAAARARGADADYFIGGQIQVSERSYELRLELHDGRDGRILATHKGSCPICSVPEVEAVAQDMARKLVTERRTPGAVPVMITSEPRGALVTIDGNTVGATPLNQTLGLGEHLIEVRKEGYFDGRRTHVIVRDTKADEVLDFSLVPRQATSLKTAFGWTALGVGGAALLTGIGLLVLDERPFRGLCEGEYVDAFGRCRFRYNTLAGGLAGVLAGSALIGGGVALLVQGRRQRGSGRRISFGAGPRGLLVSGHF